MSSTTPNHAEPSRAIRPDDDDRSPAPTYRPDFSASGPPAAAADEPQFLDAAYDDAPHAGTPNAPGQGYDALAELFLGESGLSVLTNSDRNDEDATPAAEPRAHEATTTTAAEPSTADSSRATPASVELLLNGHLPVRAAAWVMQHARAEAERQDRAVAVARLSELGLSVDLVPPPGAAKPGIGPSASAAAALAEARRRASAWIIAGRDIDEPDLLASAAPTRVTILCASNQAAIIDAFRVMKGVVDAYRRDDNDTAQPELPELRFAIVGDVDDVARVGGNLEKAARLKLGVGVEVVVAPDRIGSTNAASLFRGPHHGGAPALLDALTAPVNGPVNGPIDHPSERGSEPLQAPAPAAASPTSASAVASPQRSRSASHAADRLPLDRLARMIRTDAGAITPLDVECPSAPGVLLGVDARGGLHAIVRIDAADALPNLSAAGAWAMQNSVLLGRLLGRDISASPATAHAVTTEPSRVRPLLDTPLRLHLDTEALTAAGDSVRVCVPLN